MSLTPAESLRYARHLTLKDIGEAGQLALKNASVLCIGAGGLGSPAILYLAAAGVGTIGIVDADTVDVSNLQRQILHGESYIGSSKLESAKARIAEINPLIEVKCYAEYYTADNALEITKGYDVIIDGSDNFPTRYLTNDVAYKLGIPNIYGAVFQFSGQLTTFHPSQHGACYRCMLPEQPDASAAPT